MKNLEKWLANPLMQRLVYLLLLFFLLYLNRSNGSFGRLTLSAKAGIYNFLIVLLPLLLVSAQLIWNKRWLWGLLCGLMLLFTFWLATLSLSEIIAGAGSGGRSLIWSVGVVGFTILLVFGLAFANWMLLHMKPRG